MSEAYVNLDTGEVNISGDATELIEVRSEPVYKGIGISRAIQSQIHKNRLRAEWTVESAEDIEASFDGLPAALSESLRLGIQCRPVTKFDFRKEASRDPGYFVAPYVPVFRPPKFIGSERELIEEFGVPGRPHRRGFPTCLDQRSGLSPGAQRQARKMWSFAEWYGVKTVEPRFFQASSAILDEADIPQLGVRRDRIVRPVTRFDSSPVTTLDRVNVRRLLHHAKGVVKNANDHLIFDETDNETARARLQAFYDNVFSGSPRPSRPGVHVREVDIENYPKRIKVDVAPRIVPESISMDFSITPQNAEFYEEVGIRVSPVTSLDSPVFDRGTFRRLAFSLVRAALPDLRARELVSVQPMRQIVPGSIYFTEFVYGKRNRKVTRLDRRPRPSVVEGPFPITVTNLDYEKE